MAQILLLKDVEHHRSGQIINVRPGYARNYLIPRGFGIVADKRSLKMQEKLQAEREKLAEIDKSHSEQIASKIHDLTLTKVVKVDHDGHMYGSVSTHDILELIQQHVNIELEKKAVQLKHPIKTTGVHIINVKLKEGVTAAFNLKVMSEEGYKDSLQAVENKE